MPSSKIFFFSSILSALSRARLAILSVALTYALSLGVGIVMVQTGNQFALAYRDKLVAGARASNPASLALQKGDRWRAALSDFGQNLLLGAVPKTIAGLSIVIPYPLVAYQGWIGGIVSVDNAHVSRLADRGEAIYYIAVVILQLIPYTLSVGAGIHLGFAYLRPQRYYPGARWLGLPREAIRDVARIYLLAVPLFLLASLVEFFAA
jgi:hypothetical protein